MFPAQVLSCSARLEVPLEIHTEGFVDRGLEPNQIGEGNPQKHGTAGHSVNTSIPPTKPIRGTLSRWIMAASPSRFVPVERILAKEGLFNGTINSGPNVEPIEKGAYVVRDGEASNRQCPSSLISTMTRCWSCSSIWNLKRLDPTR